MAMPVKRRAAPTLIDMLATPAPRRPGKPGTLDPVHANVADLAWSNRQLVRMIDDLNRSVVYWLKATWRADTPPTVANDASPTREMRNTLRRRSRVWRSKFAEQGDKIAQEMTRRARRHADYALKNAFKREGITVKFRMTRPMQAVVQASVAEQTSLITGMGDDHLKRIEGAVMRSIQTGRDLEALSAELETGLGIARRRAEFIARDQTRKTTSVMVRQRGLDLGCDEADWLHSAGGVHPRPEHVAFSGKRYSLKTGALLEGKHTHPGMEPNCRCVSRLVLPGM